MPYNPEIHDRRSTRLQGYNYSQAGLYFITVCTRNKECIFGVIDDGKMILNNAGKIANDYLKNISRKYNQTRVYEFVVMPNHIHVIIEITTTSVVGAIHVGAIHESPLHEPELPLRDQRRKMLLSKIVGWYKMNTAKQINIMRQKEGTSLWQRNYYDRIIRDKQAYQKITEYIVDNPLKWNDDKFYLPKH